MGILNSVYPEIKFTVEEENGGSIAFLDVLVQRPLEGLVSTKVYRKPTHTDRILHYNSNHPVSHKVSCIKTLFKRVYSHCSTVRARVEERRHLYRICRLNGYPSRFINRHSRMFAPQRNHQDEPPQERTTRISLPYINNVSEATARLLAPHNIRVAHKPDQTLRSKIMRPKDPLPTADRSAVVYRINCMNCQCNYVGETSKRLRTRLQEHKLAIKRGEQYSQIWSHMAESDHRFDFDHTQIVASDATKGGRLLKEAWFSGKNSINRHIDMCSAQQTLRIWHMNRWRRSGHQLQDQEKDNTPPVLYNQTNTALTSDWGGIPLRDPVRPADNHQKLDQQPGRNPPTSGTYEDVDTVRLRRRRVNEPSGELTSERETVVWTDANAFKTTIKGRGGVDDRAWERTPGSRSNAPGVLDRPLMNGVNECGWLAEPSQRRERKPVLSEPMDERSGTNVTGLTTQGEDDLVKEEGEKPTRKTEWLRSGRRRSAAHTSRGDDSHKRDGRSSTKSKGMQPEPAVIMSDEWEDNTQWDGIPEPRLGKRKGRSGRNSTESTKGVESERGGEEQYTHSLTNKVDGTMKKVGELGSLPISQRRES